LAACSRSSLALFDGRTLEFLKLCNSASDAQIGGSFLLIARGMRKGEVVLLVGAVLRSRNNMIDIQLTIQQYKIDELVADETSPGLAFKQTLLKVFAIGLIKRCEILRLSPHGKSPKRGGSLIKGD
jgi:hypothetical protein